MELKDGHGTPASLATIWRAGQALDITVKKNGTAVRAARCRSIDTRWPVLGECLQRFSPAECRNYCPALRLLERHTVMKSALGPDMNLSKRRCALITRMR